MQCTLLVCSISSAWLERAPNIFRQQKISVLFLCQRKGEFHTKVGFTNKDWLASSSHRFEPGIEHSIAVIFCRDGAREIKRGCPKVCFFSRTIFAISLAQRWLRSGMTARTLFYIDIKRRRNCPERSKSYADSKKTSSLLVSRVVIG